MKKILTILTFFVGLGFSISQNFEDTPPSWNFHLKNSIPIVELAAVNLEQIQEEDSINDRDKSKPWRYGIKRELNLDLSQGVWNDLPNGNRVWQLGILSPNAINISVNFNEFEIPHGGRLYIYNDAHTDMSRTYDHDTNTPNKIMGSWFVEGELIYIEYVENPNFEGNIKLNVNSIIHGYRLGKISRYVEGATRGLNDSGDCNYDVNCSVGEDFQGRKNVIKKTVALLNLGNGYLCSASLINNTSGDKTPYLLTANHCLENSDPALWSVRFNWMSPNPICGTEEESVDLENNFTMSGGEVKASSSLSDFALIRLYNNVPTNWDIAFAGWDRRDLLPDYEVGIHHPNGDIMKICRDNTGAVKDNANGTEIWLIGGVTHGTGNGWEIGTTEGGSSGSPLFDQDGHLIGQLHGGKAFCDGTINNNDYDTYGRFAISWDEGETPESRLMEWLDPSNTGLEVVETLQNILSVPDNDLVGQLQVYPNPASDYITVLNSRYPKLSYQLYSVLGQQVSFGNVSNTMNEINIQNLNKGVYFLKLVDGDSDASVTKKIIVQK